MSKTLISVVIVVVVIVGGYFILTANKGENNSITVTTGTSSEQAAETEDKKIAFSEFVKQGGSYKCDVKQAMSDFENSGTVYISGSNVRGEFSTVAEGRTMETSFISKDGYMYNWSSLTPNMGVKIKATANTEAEAQGTYGWNADQIGDYNCEAWAADQSMFAVPANITFQAIGAQ